MKAEGRREKDSERTLVDDGRELALADAVAEDEVRVGRDLAQREDVAAEEKLQGRTASGERGAPLERERKDDGQREEELPLLTVAISSASTITSCFLARPSGLFAGGSTRPWTRAVSSYTIPALCMLATMTATDGRSGSCERSQPHSIGMWAPNHVPIEPRSSRKA